MHKNQFSTTENYVIMCISYQCMPAKFLRITKGGAWEFYEKGKETRGGMFFLVFE